MINDFCTKLSERRQELGLSIEEVVDKTKLCPSVIRNIEAANLSEINATYLKGFIRIYASCLNVDIAEGDLEGLSTSPDNKKKPFIKKKVREEIDSSEAGLPQSNSDEEETIIDTDVKHIKKPFEIKRNFVLFVLAAVFLFVSFHFVRFTIRRISQFIGKDRVEEVSSPKPSSKAGAGAPIVEKKTGKTSEEIEASLKVKRDCFIRVGVDGKLLFEGVLTKGTVEAWKGRQEIEFKISDGSAVYLEVNGSPLPSLTSMRKPIKSLKITHSGISVDK
jgi:cytoskeletal protein RodZ